MFKSKKKDVQVVGWCSATDAIIGMNREAYVGSNRERDRPVHWTFPSNWRLCGWMDVIDSFRSYTHIYSFKIRQK